MIRHPVNSEKFIKLIETENKLVFEVDPKASKPEIKEALEQLLKAKIAKVRTITTPRATKRAIVTFAADTPAIDIATKLGLM